MKHESQEIVAKTTRAIAEIAKTDKGREKCTKAQLVKVLVELLKEEYDINVLTQASRALGNICYENGAYDTVSDLTILSMCRYLSAVT